MKRFALGIVHRNEIMAKDRRFRLLISAVACLVVLLAPGLRSQTSGKKKVSNQSDLPRFTYSMSGPASDLVQADAATFNVFAAKVKADLEISLADAREIGRRHPGSDLRRTNSQPFTVERLDDLAGQNCLELQYIGILDAQIPKHVPATTDQVQLFTFHRNASFKRLRRCLTTSISR